MRQQTLRTSLPSLPRFFSAIALATVAAAGALVVSGRTSAQAPGPCDPPNGNQIVCENQKPGNLKTEWDISGAGDPSIQGFATDISVNKGSTITFKIDTNASAYHLDIYRMGYYGGMGARKITTITPSVTLPQNQPDCLSDDATGLVDCGNWAVSASWAVPSTAVTGIYFAKVIRNDTLGASHIVFIVRDDAGHSDLLFQTSDTTWQAYNEYGGNSLYVGGPGSNPGRAYKVSYNRPFATRDSTPEDWVFNAEYPMVRYLEANGFNVSYSTGVDSDRSASLLLQHKVFLSVGHDEYWSGTQRANVEAARNAGVHMAFFSGNEVFWKTRWENSISSPATARRTLVSYKETHANAKIDPAGSTVWTGTWADPRFSPPADGGKPQNALTGQFFRVNCCSTAMEVPAADGKMRFWRNTPVAGQNAGEVAIMTDGTVGYEWDQDEDNGFRPAGLFRMSETISNQPAVLTDWGSTYDSGTGQHSITIYKHTSGALVFGAGTVQWSWGLDQNHDRGSDAANISMQQATINLFADMGVQPLTVQAGLFTASASTDTLKPTSTIVSPAAGANLPQNTTITISGTAVDAGGGQVAGIEISLDNGATWHRAIGRASWTYSWGTGTPKTVTIKTRAVDDSGNIETPGAGITVNVTTAQVTCPCSIWAPTQTPINTGEADSSAIEVGVKFRSTAAGFISAIRFYKDPSNNGAHIVNLWSSSGLLLATATSTSESPSGWQQVSLPSPIAISANTTYVASYHTTSGFYSDDEQYFAVSGVANGPLQALQDGIDGHNGVYRLGVTGFPSSAFNSDNYWVDVVYVTTAPPDTTPPTVSSTTPINGSSGLAVNGNVTAMFSEAMNASTITSTNFELRNPSNVLVSATVSYNSGLRTATLNPNADLAVSTTYTARIHSGSTGVKDSAGNALATDYVWSFTTSGPPPPPPTQGPGGPILVVTSSSNPFSTYYAEILRAEGLNAFALADLSTVTSTTLNSYDVVILGEMSLTTTQVTTFSNWVTAGGNLIAMRPDKKLASLLGLTDAGTTLSDGYLLVNTSTAPGAGIVSQTMQYHSVADRYSISGATSVATLYSNATTATTNPAVTLRSVGSAGGQAAAFTYDLAKSVIDTRQGNPAWSGQERDGLSPSIRSDDLFFGGSQPNYVDLSKVAIPQADEQQRLLANMIGLMNADRKPLPKFWYFPRGFKAVVVMTGDDHALNGTAGRFDNFISASPVGCQVDDWECVRGTSYIFPNTPISAAEVAAYKAQGFEIGLHMWMSGLDDGSTASSIACNDFTPTSIAADYSQQLALFASLFPTATPVQTNRTHCIVWSDYDTQPQVALANGIRFDTNYYYWPSTWVNDVPGLFTGSGMPMRFAKLNGSMIDVYQATTQMTDESGQSYPMTINTLLDRAIGSEGYYGAFVANMHTDNAVSAGADAIVASAQTRGVPVVSSKQMLDWLDGRNNSSFGNITWNGTNLGFAVSTWTGAKNIQGMLPATFAGRPLSGLTRDGSLASYSIQTIKGVPYAFFSASAGTYQASYAVDATPPTISAVSAAPSTNSAVISWTTNELASSRVDYGTSPSSLTSTASTPGVAGAHSVTITGLNQATTYYFRVTSVDVSSNSATSPAPPASPATFTTTVPNLNCPCSVWTSAAVPGNPAANDSAAVELGMRFRTANDGFITGVRFYKSAQNIGTHVGNLWSTSGTLLGSVTFSGESASGWQQADFASPVPVTANTTYVVSYHTDTGFYAGDGGFFASSGVTSGPLQALADAPGAANGLYHYGSSAFPTGSFNSANYWVDVVFNTTAGGGDTTPPTVTTVTPSAGANGVALGAAVKATFSESINPATLTASTFALRDTANSLVAATVSYDVATKTATLQPTSPLVSTTTYVARVIGGSSGVKDFAGNPLASDFVWTFNTNSATPSTVRDVTVADFSAGTADPGIAISQMADGEVILAPTTSQEFSGTALPAGWTGTPWNTGGANAVANGQVIVDGSRVSMDATVPVGEHLDFGATFSGDSFEHVGLGLTFNETPWIMFSTGSGGALYARTHDGSVATDTLIPGNWLGTPHRFRIDWTSSGVVFFIDGAQVASHAALITTALRPIASDFGVGGGSVLLDWLRLAPYATSGTFTSRVLDSGASNTWTSATWNASVPAGTSLALSARFGNTAVPDGTWSGFVALTSSGGAISQTSRYVQYRAVLTGNGLDTPALADIVFSAPPIVAPAITISDVSVNEGNSGTTSANFTVTLSSASTSTVTVGYTTVAGTATAGSDYTTTSGTLTFAAGTTQQTIAVPVVGDLVDEPDETFQVSLSNPTNATIAVAQATGTIVDDDQATLSVNNVTVTEGNAGSVNAAFAVTMSAASSQSVTVNYATANATATAGSDYTAASGQLTFAPGETSKTVNVAVLGDTIDEPNETFTLNLSGATNASIATGTGTGTITDDDGAPSLSINSVTVTEGNTGTTTATFTVTLSAVSGQTVTVNYGTANGTATAGTDYTTTSGQLIFAPGVTTQTISVPVIGDTLDEPNETFTVGLSGAVNATIGTGTGTGTITDDDATPSLTINNVTATESSTVPATFTVTLSAASGQNVTVNYATSNGTATAGSDYTAIPTTQLVFSPGQTSKTITVPLLEDSLDEANETFTVNLSSAVNATIADSQGVGTITDNDPTPSLAINNATVTEGNSGTVSATFTVTLSAASGQTVTVNYATASGTATSGSDFTSTSGQLSFSPGQTSKTIAVPVLGDTRDEPNETFNLNLSSVVNATIADSQGLGTINDDDPTPTLSINDVTISEGTTGNKVATFTISLSAASGQNVSVNWATANGTATAGSDYNSGSGTATITAGNTTTTVSVTIRGDATLEPDETFFVNLSSPSNATIADSQGVGTITNDDL